MQIDYFFKKQHIFKKRRINFYAKYKETTYLKNTFVYSVKPQRLEFIYLKLLRKFFRRRRLKQRIRFFHSFIWLNLYVNRILSQKSKNSRMGAGVGAIVRLCSHLYPGTLLFSFSLLVDMFLRKLMKKLSYRIPLTLVARSFYFNLNC